MIRYAKLIAQEKYDGSVSYDVLEWVKVREDGPIVQRFLYHGDVMDTAEKAIANAKSKVPPGDVIWRDE